MTMSCRVSLASLALLVLAACAAPTPRFSEVHFRMEGGYDAVVDILVEARRVLVPGGDGELAPLRQAIESHCDDLIHTHDIAYRGHDAFGKVLMRPGRIECTQRDLDWAIDGEGFFQVTLPDQTIAFTRAGKFSLDSNGDLVTPEGHRLAPQVTVPQNVTRIYVDSTGLVQGFDPCHPQQLQTLGQLQTSRFSNPCGLQDFGNGLYRETCSSGAKIDGPPGSARGFGMIRQGFLEQSNVDTLETIQHLVEELRRYKIALAAWRIKQELR